MQSRYRAIPWPQRSPSFYHITLLIPYPGNHSRFLLLILSSWECCIQVIPFCCWVVFYGMNCWPSRNRLPDISSAKIGLFGISKKIACPRLQPWWAPCKSPSEGRWTLSLKEEEVGKATVNRESLAFHWQSFCQERKSFPSFFWAQLLSQAWELPLLDSNWDFCFWNFLLHLLLRWH